MPTTNLPFPDVAPHLYIGGKWLPSSDDSWFEVTDPGTGEVLTKMANGTVLDAAAAVDAAAAAAADWAAVPPRRRADILLAGYQQMIDHRDDLARLIVLENGKSWADAVGEVTYAADFFRWYAEEAVRITGHLQTAPNGDKRILVVQHPIGPSILITPWNFPAAMATRKIGPALAAGCTVVLKPASDTPLTALVIAHLLEQAGVPAGVVNVVTSRRSGPVVDAMLRHPEARKVSFTGSTEVGRTLLATASEQVLSSSMELGGNAPFLVLEDADIPAAIQGALVAKMRNGGQSCIAANRFLVHSAVAEAFATGLAEELSKLSVGHGLDRAVACGPMINDRAVADIDDAVKASVNAGATVLTGGEPLPRTGAYYPPTVLTDVAPDNPINDVEIFGPVAPITTFDDDEQAIALANGTPFGLASYLYSGELARALRVAEALHTGMVGVNRGFISDPAAPFGGVKQSGLGREGGNEGIHEYLETQYIAVDW